MNKDLVSQSFLLSSALAESKPNISFSDKAIKFTAWLSAKLDNNKIYPNNYDTFEEIEELLDKIPLTYDLKREKIKYFLGISSSVNFARELDELSVELIEKRMKSPHPLYPDKDSGEYVPWFAKVSYSSNKGLFSVTINRYALYNLVIIAKYSKIRFEYLKPLKSGYSVYTYLFLKILKDISNKKLKIEEKVLLQDLRERLGCSNKYKMVMNFKNKVLDIAKYEINKFTDLTFDYELKKEGRAFKYINLYFDYKKPTNKLEKTDFVPIVLGDDYNNSSIFEETLFAWGIRAKKITEIESIYSLESIQRSIEETEKTEALGKIKTSKAAFFFGTLVKKQLVEDEIFDRDINLIKEKEVKNYKRNILAIKDDVFWQLQTLINSYEEEFSKILTAFSIGSKLKISYELEIELDKIKKIDFEEFADYKTSQAILEKGFYDIKIQKIIRPNIYNFMLLINKFMNV